MKTTLRKALALLLCLSMCLSLFPAAFAEEGLEEFYEEAPPEDAYDSALVEDEPAWSEPQAEDVLEDTDTIPEPVWVEDEEPVGVEVLPDESPDDGEAAELSGSASEAWGQSLYTVRFTNDKGYDLAGLIVTDAAGREIEPADDWLYLLSPGTYFYRYHDGRGIFLDLEETAFTVDDGPEIPLTLTPVFFETLITELDINPFITVTESQIEAQRQAMAAEIDRVTLQLIADDADGGASGIGGASDKTTDAAIEEAGELVRAAMVAREPSVSYTVTSRTKWDIEAVMNNIFKAAIRHTGRHREGDTLQWEKGVASKGASWSYNGYVYTNVFTYTFDYISDAAQEQATANRVESLVDTLGLTGKSSYAKVCAIHEYLYNNVDYDYSKTKHSAYNALIENTSVCQGFATAFYRLCLAAGLEARVVSSQTMGHGWNIVKLDDSWYYVDSTWDSNYRDGGRLDLLPFYFLRGSDWWLENHDLDGVSELGDEFNPASEMYDTDFDKYNVSKTDYVPPAGPVIIASDTWGTLPWTLDDTGLLTISGSGKMDDFTYEQCEAGVAWHAYKDSIQSVVIKNGVTGIGNWAFVITSLTSITLPNSVTSIGDYAFCGCSGLTSITLPVGVTGIGDYAFVNCSGLTSITIPEGVTSISDGAFSGCERLTSITLPVGVTSIGDRAFFGCTGLTSITIPVGVTGIGDYAFYACNSLTSITIPVGVTGIGDYAFYGCTGLKSIKLPAGVTGIGDYAFEYCRSLTSITLPVGMTGIGDYAFAYCTGLLRFTIPEGVTSIGSSAFCGCTGLMSINIPDTVTSIGDQAFFSCAKLIAVYYGGTEESWHAIDGNEALDDALIKYGSSGGGTTTWTLNESGVLTISGSGEMDDFNIQLVNDEIAWHANRESITSVVINNGVTSIGDYAFAYCTGLKSITIPDSVTSIGDYAFANCNGLTSIKLPAGVTGIGDYAFAYCTGLTSIKLPAGVISIGDYAFYSCNGLTSITMQEGLTSIGDYAFYWCEGLTSITLPAGVTSIGDYAFARCNGLTSITMQEGVTSIGDWAFSDCTGLLRFRVPEGVTSIGDYAFSGCWHLMSINIPDSVTSVGDHAFYSCSNLIAVYYGGTEESWNAIEGNVALDDAVIKYGAYGGGTMTWTLNKSGVLTISGSGEMDDFNNETMSSGIAWHANRESITSVVINSGVTSIGDYAFSGCTGLKSITIPDSVTDIGDYAFYHCMGLKSITIPEGVTGIGEQAFAICSGLTTITLPDTVTSIGVAAFNCCTGLKSITIPESVTSIGSSAFEYCNGLTSIKIPEGVTGIGDWTFYCCNGLKSITIPEGVTSIGDLAFANCNGLTSIIIPDSVTSIGNSAFLSCDALTDVYYGASKASWNAIDIGENNDGLNSATMHYVETYTISYDANGGAGAPEKQTKKTGKVLSLSTEKPVRDSGVESFTVTLDANGGAVTPASLTAERTTGYAFKNWNTMADGTGTVYAPGATYSADADTTLYAQWNSSAETAAVELPTPTRDGYLFKGWATSADAESGVTGSYTPVGNATLYAAWDLVRPTAETLKDFSLDRAYLTAPLGGEAQSLRALGLDAAFAGQLEWSVEDANYLPAGDDAAIALTHDGLDAMVTPKAVGMAWAVASIKDQDGVLHTARCRIDVTEDAHSVTGVFLPETKATVELYRTDYTRLPVSLLRQTTTGGASTADTSALEDNGAAVESARFDDTAAASVFDLRVADDRNLEIIPKAPYVTTDKNVLKAVKGSYKTRILLTVEGREFTTDPVTITVKKTMPKLTVKAGKLNSALPDVTQPLVFTGGTVKSLSIQTNPKNAFALTDDGMALRYVGKAGANASDNLTLEAELDGWALSCTTKLAASAAATLPKLTAKPASLTIKPDGDDTASTEITISLAAFADRELKVLRIEEGKTNLTDRDTLVCGIDGNALRVNAGPDFGSAAKARTFKLTLGLEGLEDYKNAQASVTVKTLAIASAVTLTAKATGFIDTGIPNSPATLTVTPKNYNADSVEKYLISVTAQNTKTKAVTTIAELESDSSVIVLTQDDLGALDKANAYTAEIRALLPDGTETAAVKVKLPVKFTDSAKAQPSVTLKLSGNLDVIRPATSVTVTPTFKNYFGYTQDASDLVFYKVVGKNTTQLADAPFEVRLDGNRYIVTLREGAAIDPKTEKYSVGLRIGSCATKSPSSLNIKMGAVKISQSAKTLTLLKNDPYDSAVLTLAPDAADVTDIALVKLVADKNSASFTLTDLGGGQYAIGYKDHTVPEKLKSASLKLQVFLKGNGSVDSAKPTPNATVSVTVKIA